MTTVVRFPEQRGRWAWDARGDNRAVRVSAHVREHVVNLSVWRDDLCVGTVRLQPSEAAALVTGLTEGIAQLTEHPAAVPPQVRALEDRVARLEARLAEPDWRATATRIARSVRGVVGRHPRSA
jgi:hypothetical protein